MNIQRISKAVVAGASIASLAIIPSCAKLDPDYAEYKKQKNAQSTDPYGAPALSEENGYAIPGTEGQATAPYQPLPGVPNYPPVVEDNLAQAVEEIPQPYTPAPSQPASETTHTVVRGDTIWGITKKYGITADALRQANNLTSDVIKLDQILIIPAR
jgi:LysM repeat protein